MTLLSLNITNITAEMLAGRPTDRRACVVCNIYETWGIYHAYAEQPNGTLVALIGSGRRPGETSSRSGIHQRSGFPAAGLVGPTHTECAWNRSR